MLKKHLKKIFLDIKAPKHISRNFKHISHDKQNELRAIIKQVYFGNLAYSQGVTSEDYLVTTEGKADVENHLSNRLSYFRNTIIPWLCSIKDLKNSRILEIGCGTGSSTLALAEQGAIVTGIDIDEASIQVAKNRAKIYDADYTIFQENATNINKFSDQSFDFIIFFAALEHMTINERIDSLKKAWSQLSKGAILVIIETPNRLWFRDGHTSLLPFFHWLPDQLAFYYSSMSPRNNFYRFANDIGNEVPETFHRLGRGASYHEFEIAMGKDALSNVVGDLDSFMLKNPLCALKNVFYKGNGYYNLIKQINPQIHSSFFHQDLNLAIGKN